MLDRFQNVFKIPELRDRILFTLLILLVYRIGGHVPVAGINASALAEFFQQNQKEAALKKFQEATEANPLNAEAWLWVGRTTMEQGQSGAAGDSYLQALKAEPGNKTAITFLRKLKRAFPKDLLIALRKPIVLPVPQATPAAINAGDKLDAPGQTNVPVASFPATPAIT